MTYDSLFDKTYAGRRIKLIHTDDQYTKLKPGDMGTIRFFYKNADHVNVCVNWDSGSNLDMIFGVDQFEIIGGLDKND